MAFPSINGTITTTVFSGLETVQNVNLPSGIVAGEMLMIFGLVDRQRTLPTGLVSGGYLQVVFNFNDPEFFCYYKIASGSEGSTISLTYAAGCNATYATVRISNFDSGEFPETSTSSAGSSVNPNSNAITPSWGAADMLVFSFFSCLNTAAETISAQPSGYSVPYPTLGTGAVSYRAVSGASEDPGSFTISPSISWRACTVAVKGGAVLNLARNYGSTIYG